MARGLRGGHGNGDLLAGLAGRQVATRAEIPGRDLGEPGDVARSAVGKLDSTKACAWVAAAGGQPRDHQK
jgi:hypothetical protein